MIWNVLGTFNKFIYFLQLPSKVIIFAIVQMRELGLETVKSNHTTYHQKEEFQQYFLCLSFLLYFNSFKKIYRGPITHQASC